MKQLAVAVLALAAVAALPLSAQQAPPATEVFLAGLSGPASSATGPIASWMNISNSPGYDNQPSFLPDGKAILFSSQRDGKQMDIYRFDIASKKLTQVTSTPEGEYSPTVTPDRKSFSVIRTEADSTQRLWRFDMDGSHPRLVLENVKPVGYHAWIDETHLALFILGSNGAPATLQIADTKTGLATVAATGIGRSVLIRPRRGTVSYLATGETPRVLKEFDAKTKASTPLFAPVEGSQDCAWMSNGVLLMAKGTIIYGRASADSQWSTWVDFSTKFKAEISLNGMPSPPFANITRMAVSPDGKWLAFVAEPVAK